MSPGDLIRIENDFWQVEAVHFGAMQQESVVELRRIGYSFASVNGQSLPSSFVPHRMLRALTAGEEADVYAPAMEVEHG